MRRITARSFFEDDACTVAESLLGCTLVSCLGGIQTGGVIVETEAYMGVTDAACHTFCGRRTARNEIMYAGGGFAYVYLIYGMHCCFNVVCSHKGSGEAVLIRALQPTIGIEEVKARRGTNDIHALCSGPGKLCRALYIDRTANGADLTSGDIFIAERDSAPNVVRSPRINIDYSGQYAAKPWRYTIKDSSFVSVNPKQ